MVRATGTFFRPRMARCYRRRAARTIKTRRPRRPSQAGRRRGKFELCRWRLELTIQGMNKDQVAEILVEIGTLLELKGENPFKTRAYANAARILEGLSEPLDQLIAEDRLGEIKGIGEGIAKKITELVTTGKLAYYDELKASIPPGLVAMLDIPGLGPKKIQALNQKLGVDSIAKLEQACQAGK